MKKIIIIIAVLLLLPIAFAQESTDISDEQWNQIIDSGDISSLNEDQLTEENNHEKLNDFFSKRDNLVKNPEKFKEFTGITQDLDMDEGGTYDPETKTLKNGESTIDIDKIKEKSEVTKIIALKNGGFKLVIGTEELNIDGKISVFDNKLQSTGDGLTKIKDNFYEGTIVINDDGTVLGDGQNTKINNQIFSGNAKINGQNDILLLGKGSFIDTTKGRFTANEDGFIEVKDNIFKCVKSTYTISKSTFHDTIIGTGDFEATLTSDTLLINNNGIQVQAGDEKFGSNKEWELIISEQEKTSDKPYISLSLQKKIANGDIYATFQNGDTKYIKPIGSLGRFSLSKNDDFSILDSHINIISESEEKTLKGTVRRINGAYSLFNQDGITSYYNAKTDTLIKPVDIDKPLHVLDSAETKARYDEIRNNAAGKPDVVYESENGIVAEGKFDVKQDSFEAFSKNNNFIEYKRSGDDFSIKAEAKQTNGNKDFIFSFGKGSEDLTKTSVINGKVSFQRQESKDSASTSSDFSGNIRKNVIYKLPDLKDLNGNLISINPISRVDSINLEFFNGKSIFDQNDLQRVASSISDSTVLMKTTLTVTDENTDKLLTFNKGGVMSYENLETGKKVMLPFVGELIGNQDLLIMDDDKVNLYNQIQEKLKSGNVNDARQLASRISIDNAEYDALKEKMLSGTELSDNEKESIGQILKNEKFKKIIDGNIYDFPIQRNQPVQKIVKDNTAEDSAIVSSSYQIGGDKLNGADIINNKVKPLSDKITELKSDSENIKKIIAINKDNPNFDIEDYSTRLSEREKSIKNLQSEANSFIDAMNIPGADESVQKRLKIFQSELKSSIRDFSGAKETIKEVVGQDSALLMIKAAENIDNGNIAKSITSLNSISPDSVEYNRAQQIKSALEKQLVMLDTEQKKSELKMYNLQAQNSKIEAESIADPNAKSWFGVIPAEQVVTSVFRQGANLLESGLMTALELTNGNLELQYSAPSLVAQKDAANAAIAERFVQGSEIRDRLIDQGMSLQDIDTFTKTATDSEVMTKLGIVGATQTPQETFRLLKETMSHPNTQRTLELLSSGDKLDSGKWAVNSGDFFKNTYGDIGTALNYYTEGTDTQSISGNIAQSRVDEANKGGVLSIIPALFGSEQAAEDLIRGNYELRLSGSDATLAEYGETARLAAYDVGNALILGAPLLTKGASVLSKTAVMENILVKSPWLARAVELGKTKIVMPQLMPDILNELGTSYRYGYNLAEDSLISKGLISGKSAFTTDILASRALADTAELELSLSKAAYYDNLGDGANAQKWYTQAESVLEKTTNPGLLQLKSISPNINSVTSPVVSSTLKSVQESLQSVTITEKIGTTMSDVSDQIVAFKDKTLRLISDNIDQYATTSKLTSRTGGMNFLDDSFVSKYIPLQYQDDLIGVSNLIEKEKKLVLEFDTKLLSGQNTDDIAEQIFKNRENIAFNVDDLNFKLISDDIPKIEQFSDDMARINIAKPSLETKEFKIATEYIDQNPRILKPIDEKIQEIRAALTKDELLKIDPYLELRSAEKVPPQQFQSLDDSVEGVIRPIPQQEIPVIKNQNYKSTYGKLNTDQLGEKSKRIYSSATDEVLANIESKRIDLETQRVGLIKQKATQEQIDAISREIEMMENNHEYFKIAHDKANAVDNAVLTNKNMQDILKNNNDPNIGILHEQYDLSKDYPNAIQKIKRQIDDPQIINLLEEKKFSEALRVSNNNQDVRTAIKYLEPKSGGLQSAVKDRTGVLVGGDGFVLVDDADEIKVFVADGMGKGLGTREFEPSELVAELKIKIEQSSDMPKFNEINNDVAKHNLGFEDPGSSTGKYVRIPKDTGIMEYKCMGDEIFVFSKGETSQVLASKNSPIGLYKDMVDSGHDTYVANKDSLVVLLTDGFEDCVNPLGDRLGKESIINKIQELVDQGISPKQISYQFDEWMKTTGFSYTDDGTAVFVGLPKAK